MNNFKYLIVVLLLCTFCFNLSFANKAADSIANDEAYYVGEIGPEWQFPSDHLPIGATIDNFHIAFWNILNKDYLFHIEENTQGLKYSSILTDNIPDSEHQRLTQREMMVVNGIKEMLNHPTHPRSVLALEETHPDVLNFLKDTLAEKWVIVAPPGQPSSQDIFIYDREIFDCMGIDAVRYTKEQPKTIFTITLQGKSTNRIYRFVQSHIPGGPVNSPEACAKFSMEAMRQFEPSMTIVLMGDMNQSPTVINQALITAAAKQKFSEQIYLHLPIEYPTHINTQLEAAWIDNFFVYVPDQKGRIHSNNPAEICSLLTPIVDLLKNIKNKE